MPKDRDLRLCRSQKTDTHRAQMIAPSMSTERVEKILTARAEVISREENLKRATRIFVAAADAVAQVPARKGARQNSVRRRKSEASKRGRAWAKAWAEWEVAEALEREARAKLRIVGVTFHSNPDDE